MQFLKLLVLLLLVNLISCQDTKTPPKKKQTIVKKESKTPRRDSLLKVFAQRIKNETVVSFYEDYGPKNPETKVKITTKFGEIEIELFEDTPLHRANFIHITKKGFLSKTCFYRVAKGFVIQGGNSDSFEMSKIKTRIGKFSIPAEFIKKRKHTYGAVAMARTWKNNPKKRSSPFEFYIVVDAKGAHHLDGEHTVFGRVTKGMDVAKKINRVKVDKSEWPIDDVYMKVEIIP